MSIEEIREVFAALHDGSIVACRGDKQRLQLTVSCQYLAERIAVGYELFYLELQDVAELQLEAWLPGNTTELWDEWEAIAALELEVIAAEAVENTVIIYCGRPAAGSGICGGKLHLRCAAVAVYDQQFAPCPTERLRQLVADYWRDWTHHN